MPPPHALHCLARSLQVLGLILSSCWHPFFLSRLPTLTFELCDLLVSSAQLQLGHVQLHQCLVVQPSIVISTLLNLGQLSFGFLSFQQKLFHVLSYWSSVMYSRVLRIYIEHMYIPDKRMQSKDYSIYDMICNRRSCSLHYSR